MTAHATEIKVAQDLLRDKIMDKLRANPKAWGKVTLELTIQDGKIVAMAATDSETRKVNQQPH